MELQIAEDDFAIKNEKSLELQALSSNSNEILLETKEGKQVKEKEK
jgi:hypothetical protein